MSRKVKNARTEQPVITDGNGKKAASTGNGSKSSTRWANIDIRTKEHKDAIKALSGDVDFVLDTLIELVDDGYDLHVKRVDEGSTVTAMLFCGSGVQCSQNAGLSAAAPDAWLAVSSIIYKHAIVCKGKWFSDDGADQDDGWR